MAITVVGSTNSGVGGDTANKPTGLMLDDFMVAWVFDNAGAPTPPTGWSQQGLRTTYGGGAATLWQKPAGASEPASYQWTGSLGVGLVAYRGVALGNPVAGAVLDVLGSATTTPTTATVDIQTADAALFAGCMASAASTFTPPTGMTEQWDVDGLTGDTEILVGAGPGNTSKQWTASQSSEHVTVIVVLQPDTGGGGGPPPGSMMLLNVGR